MKISILILTYIGGEVDYSIYVPQLDNIVSSKVEYLGLIRS